MVVDVCNPSFFALGVSIFSRKKSLAAKGITERENCLMRAIDAYKTPLSSRRSKPIIEADIIALSMAEANEYRIHAESTVKLMKNQKI